MERDFLTSSVHLNQIRPQVLSNDSEKYNKYTFEWIGPPRTCSWKACSRVDCTGCTSHCRLGLCLAQFAQVDPNICTSHTKRIPKIRDSHCSVNIAYKCPQTPNSGGVSSLLIITPSAGRTVYVAMTSTYNFCQKSNKAPATIPKGEHGFLCDPIILKLQNYANYVIYPLT